MMRLSKSSKTCTAQDTLKKVCSTKEFYLTQGHLTASLRLRPLFYNLCLLLKLLNNQSQEILMKKVSNQ